MSFFIRKGQPNGLKRKGFKPNTKQNVKKTKENKKYNDDITSESEEGSEHEKEIARSDSEEEYETAQEKRLSLAKKYLEEISRAEQERADRNEFINESSVSQRLKEDYLEQVGRLQKCVADTYEEIKVEDINVLRCKEHKDSVISVVISPDNKFIYSGSKNGTVVIWSVNDRKKIKSLPFKRKDGSKNSKGPKPISALAVSHDCKYLAIGEGKEITIRDATTLNSIHVFKGHKDTVTGLVFRRNSNQLYSASNDRSVRVWSLDEMSYVESMFGHQSGITGIDALHRERAVTSGGSDSTLRVWKIAEDSQLIYNATGSVDNVKLINEDHFISGGDNGNLCIWSASKKKPLCTVKAAHGVDPLNSQPNWIASVTSLLNTDLVASGSSDGFITLWRLRDHYRKLETLFKIPVKGFVNSLAFTSDGSTLVAAVGREHRLGRWWSNKEAKNAVLIIPLTMKK